MFTFTKISLVVAFIIIIAAIAQIMGKLDAIYTSYILLVGLATQVAILIVFVATILIRRNELKKGVKIIRYKYEDRYIKGEENVLPKFITTTNPRKASIFKIYFEIKDFKELPDFGIYKIGKGDPDKTSDVKKQVLNVNTGISNDLFIFHVDMLVRPDEKINFKFKNDANIKIFLLGELYIP